MTSDSALGRDRTAANLVRNQIRDTAAAPKSAARRVDLLLARPLEQEVVCRKCHWKCSRRSRRKSVLDIFLALFLLRPFRCRSCRRRYYRLAL
jgi:hypothetical protein